ncbi:MAG TPA: 4-(cytidine 5'-diphospho)-2-C-methyl-D-erythritol kinase [Firmicutes bacterium]|nr:4-(cytidine 5'-diphospho)-2-C-methyl-D-erythritol kinase [Bacillota bacterium]
MDKITVKAYGKVNLTLDVQGRRADGYHLLSSVMQSISLADTITLQKAPQGITIQSDHPLVPNDQDNICWRAAQAFLSQSGIATGVKIELMKAIPVAAGLGGGSADAAAVLYGLNQLYGTDLSLGKLQTIGLTIGADVPFCLQGGTCLVEGIGEVVTPVEPFPQTNIVLVKPEASVSTAEIYKKLDSSSHGGTSTRRLLAFLQGDQSVSLDSVLENALESVTETLVPAVTLWKSRLREHGAVASLMSGSGPTVFGLFESSQQAQEFHGRFKEEAGVFVVTLSDKGVCVSESNGGDQQ